MNRRLIREEDLIDRVRLAERRGDAAKGGFLMGGIQLALSDAGKATALLGILSRSTTAAVQCVESPSIEESCVVVVDVENFERLPRPLRHPERVVLIAPKNPGNLGHAWDAGVSSVLSDEDPMNTVVLAILAACLRSGSARPRPVGAPEQTSARPQKRAEAI
jgi:hypothetical protein